MLRRNALTNWHSNLWIAREIFSGVIAGVGKNKRVNDDGVSGERGESLDCFTGNISGSEG